MSSAKAWLALTLPWLAAAAGCSGSESFEINGHRYRADAVTQWALPRGLREASGLTLDPRQRLFGHGDEVAEIFQIDYHAGKIVKRFAFGQPAVAGDFEGIAWVDGSLYLVTSDGELLSGPEGADGAHVDYRRQYTGLGQRCEIEGLDYDAANHRLLMLCKNAREPALRHQIVVLPWSLSAQAAEPAIRTPWPSQRPAVHPSGLAIAPDNGHMILVAARERALIELTGDGTLVNAFALPRDTRHPQMEGIAITPDGDLVIADEGKKRGRLSVYAPD